MALMQSDELRIQMGTLTGEAASVALAASLVVKAVPGDLVAIYGYNGSASNQFIQIHDAAALPADAAVPLFSFIAKAGDNFFFEPPKKIEMRVGIVVCNSSTQPTKTIGAADCWFNVLFD